MIKKIPIHKVKIGMYVYDLNCSWAQHPFAMNQFKITQEDEVNKIKKTGVKEFYIDTEKGMDVEEDLAMENIEADSELESLSPDASGAAQKTPLTSELLRASKVKQEAIRAISTIMEEARLGKLIDVGHIEQIVEDIVLSALCNKDALLGLMRLRRLDKYTFEHSVSVSILLVAFAESLALSKDELIQVGMGGLLMDIGKSITPPKILTKPGKLSKDEFATMRKHVVYSQEILEKMQNASEIVMNIATEHHERLDGTGYPAGKKGDDISFYGQMAAIVDVYDALTVNRVYCLEISPNAALKKLMLSKEEFNQEFVQQFIHCVGIYPIGSLVALSNGLFAVVIESGNKGLLHPIVRVIFDSIKRQFITPQDINLLEQDEKEMVTIVSAIEPSKWRINPADFIEHARYN